MHELIKDLQDLIEDNLENNGALCLIDKNRQYSWSEFCLGVIDRKNDLLDRGVSRGDVLILHGDYSFDSITSLFALILVGCVVVPRVRVSETDIDQICKYCCCKYLLEFGDGIHLRKMNSPNAQINPRITAIGDRSSSGLILLSSGTSGVPKMALHDVSNFLHNKIKFRKKSKNKTIALLIFDHIGGLNTLFSVLLSGGCLVIPSDKSVDIVCRNIEDHKVVTLPTSPTYLNLLMIDLAHQKFNLSSLKLITYGSEAMPDSLLERCREALPNARFIQTYGSTEVGILDTSNAQRTKNFFQISDVSSDYKIVDGELYIRSSRHFSGYLNVENKDRTDGDGWHPTGDVVEVDDDGALKVVGRVDDIINVGGEKVFPSEVENELLKTQLVAECRVRRQPNPITGEIVAADIVLAPGLDERGIRSSIRRKLQATLSDYKIPTKINIVDTIGHGARLKKSREAV